MIKGVYGLLMFLIYKHKLINRFMGTPCIGLKKYLRCLLWEGGEEEEMRMREKVKNLIQEKMSCPVIGITGAPDWA